MNIDPTDLSFAQIVIRAEVKKLRARGVIRRDDQDDIASELMVQLLGVWERYDPARGSREAFINQVVNTRLVSLLRERRAQKRRGTTEPVKDRDRLVDRQWFGDEWLRRLELRIDLGVALSKLNPRQRAICDQLLREAITPAAKQMGVPRTTLRDAAARIREIFRDAGLEDYL